MWIRATNDDGRVALWERDAAHPNGELFLVADGRIVEAGLTPAVAQLLASGLAVEARNSAETGPEPAGGVGAQTGADSAEIRPKRRRKRSS